MRTDKQVIKYKYIVDMLQTSHKEHAELLDRLLSENQEKTCSFALILKRKIRNEMEVIDDIWAFKKIISAIREYILRYHAPASVKQHIYAEVYALCEHIALERAIDNYKEYLDILPEPVSDDITISLIKALHNREGITKEDFARKHTVDPRTIQNKIQALDGNPRHNPLRIGGFSVHVPVEHHKESASRDAVQRYYTPNTMNPLVLQLNTIQTATLLQSLHYNNHKEGNYLPLDLAIDIWCQLSDYTKKRIREIFCRNDLDFAEFLDWIEFESKSSSHQFMSEAKILEERNTSKSEMLLIAHKGGMVCDIHLGCPLRSRSNQRIMYDFGQHRYYAVSADSLDGERLYFTEDEVEWISEHL